MIVVVGSPAWREAPPAGPAGRACDIAIAAATRGARTEIVGRVGDDPAGDTLVISLGHAGVGHAALLRDPAMPTMVLPPPRADGVGLLDDEPPPPRPAVPGPRLQPADVALALRYLAAFGVLVVADDVPPDALPACVEGAAFSDARMVVIVRPGRRPPDGLPADATVLAAPGEVDDGAFAALVGAYAVALDAGDGPAAAFRAATEAVGWEPAEPA